MITVLANRFITPPLPAGAVQRPRLLSRLHEGRQRGHRLLLVAAPAGYGKTTLFLSWLAQENVDHAWVALNEEDNDPCRFFACLVAALGRVYPGLEEALMPLLSQPQKPSPRSLVNELINVIAAGRQPFCLVLDDYHLIHNLEAHAQLQRLLENLPPGLCVVLLTRQDPPLPLARLRARAQMTELRQQDLRFTREEAGELLGRLLPAPLTPDQLAVLEERTEGWAAGLQLAGLSLQNYAEVDRFLEEFRGTHRYIIDYLVEEVLSRLEPELVDFVRRSALLDRFSPELCNAALQRADSREMLRRVEAANLFLVPLDEHRSWFRYHHLLADILPEDLPPKECEAILHRAAHWLADHGGDPGEAIQYAQASGDTDLAARLVRQAALPTMEKGQIERVLAWLKALPEETLLAEPELALYQAWLLVLTAQIRRAGEWLARLERELPADLPPALHGLRLCLQAWQQRAAGIKFDLDVLLEARRLMEGGPSYFLPPLLLAIAQTYRELGNIQVAEDVFVQAQRLAESSNQLATALMIAGNRAFTLDAAGRREEAFAICRSNLARYTRPDGQVSLLGGIPCLELGCLLYHSGEYEAAYKSLTQGMNLVRRLGVYGMMASPGIHCLALLLGDQGKIDEAFDLLRETRRYAGRIGLDAMTEEVDLAETELNLRLGNYQSIASWARRQAALDPLPGEAMFRSRKLRLAQFWASEGKFEQAFALVESQVAVARSTGFTMELVEALVARVRVCLAARDSPSARSSLLEALSLAAPQNYRFPFQPIEEIRPLLESLRVTGLTAAPTQPGTQAERLRYFIAALLAGIGGTSPKVIATLVEPLGERELEILRLAAAGLSNHDISDRLYITTGTVKWHLNNLFGKLGVSSRTQAAARARELGLI